MPARLQKLPQYASDEPTELPIGEWMPDQPPLSSASSIVYNVVPRTASSYGPFLGFTPQSTSALGARCQGCAPLKLTNGDLFLYAGDAANLYSLQSGAAGFTTLTRAAGGTYTAATDQFWNFTAFGNRVIAAQVNDNLQSMLVGTDTKFSDVAGAPRARYCKVLKDFLFLLNTWDSTAGFQPQRAWWSAIGNPTSFPTPGSLAAAEVQSDNQDLFDGDFGAGTGIVGPLGAADAAIFMEKGIYRAQYVGSPAIWEFQIAQGAKGCRAPSSIVGFRNIAYYLSDDGFYSFDGINSVPIGAEKWDRTILATLDPTQLARVQAAVDPINKLIFWCLPLSGDGGNSAALLAYNWQLNRASAIILPSPVEAICSGIGFPTTLDSLDALGTLDSLPYTLDSSAWTGGSPVLAAFDTSHKLNYALGTSLAATVETSEIQPYRGRRARVVSARPLVDGGAPTIAIAARERLQDAAVYAAAQPMNAIGECPQRIEGRYLRAQVKLPAGSSFGHIQGVDLSVLPRGGR